MKNLLLIIFIFTFSTKGFSQNLDSLDSKTSFREFKYGEHYTPSSMSNMVESPLISTFMPNSKQKFYYKENDNFEIGTLKAKTIYYIFCDSIFVGYNIIFNSVNDYSNVSNILHGLYGNHTNSEILYGYASLPPKITWEGNINTCTLMLFPKTSGFGYKTYVGFLNKTANNKSLKVDNNGF